MNEVIWVIINLGNWIVKPPKMAVLIGDKFKSEIVFRFVLICY